MDSETATEDGQGYFRLRQGQAQSQFSIVNSIVVSDSFEVEISRLANRQFNVEIMSQY